MKDKDRVNLSPRLTEEERDNVQIMMTELEALKQFRDWERVEYFVALSEFALIFRADHGISAMIDYLRWARRHGESDLAIRATIMHDLNGRNDKWMSPRTSGYLGVNEEEDQERLSKLLEDK